MKFNDNFLPLSLKTYISKSQIQILNVSNLIEYQPGRDARIDAEKVDDGSGNFEE
jgi:hypothetical protein